MRTRQTAQGFDASDRYDGFGVRREPSVDGDVAYGFRGTPHEPVRVHPDLLHHPLHRRQPPYPTFGVIGPEQEFGVHPPSPYGSDPSWPRPAVRERAWGPPGYRYGGSERGYGERASHELRSRDGADRGGEPDLYRPHRGPHFGKGPKGYQRADDRIRDEICERLARDGYIDASGIEVAVAGGVVRLLGSVQQVEDRHAVERVILDVYGVQEVRSELRLERSESQQSAASNDAGEQGRR